MVRSVLPGARSFKPDAVLISAGFDAHIADPLSAINLSTDFYRWMTAQMMEIADACSNGRLISLLEGGYDLHALAECIGIHLHNLNNSPEQYPSKTELIFLGLSGFPNEFPNHFTLIQ